MTSRKSPFRATAEDILSKVPLLADSDRYVPLRDYIEAQLKLAFYSGSIEAIEDLRETFGRDK